MPDAGSSTRGEARDMTCLTSTRSAATRPTPPQITGGPDDDKTLTFTFAIAATDRAGNTDRTPAVAKIKVKKARG